MNKETVETNVSNGLIEVSIDKLLFEQVGISTGIEFSNKLDAIVNVAAQLKSSYTKADLEKRVIDLLAKYPQIFNRNPGIAEWFKLTRDPVKMEQELNKIIKDEEDIANQREENRKEIDELTYAIKLANHLNPILGQIIGESVVRYPKTMEKLDDNV